MKTDCVYKIQENYIDLSQIKTFRLAKNFANDKEKKRIEITLKDRVTSDNDNADTIDIIFESESSATKAGNELAKEWEQFIRENNNQRIT